MEIIKTVQKEKIKKINAQGYLVEYLGYNPQLQEDEYLALTVKDKLCKPTQGKPYITKNKNSFLFNDLYYNNKHQKMVIVKCYETDGTLLTC